MKCQGCGHDFPDTISRCPRCHRLSDIRRFRSTESRLIEFPRKPRTVKQPEPAESTLPAWRRELNAKVREVRARRSGPGTADDAPAADLRTTVAERPHTALNGEGGEVTARRHSQPARETAQVMASKSPAREQQPSHQRPATNNAIVEKALTRVRRATENAHRAALPKIEPVRPAQRPTASLGLDREATARQLTPEVDLSPRRTAELDPIADLLESPRQSTEVVEPTQAYKPTSPLQAEAKLTSFVEAEDHVASARFIPDEIEPRDYLEAEIRKVDKELNAEFARNESPSIVIHAILNLTDFIAISVSAAPFLAVIEFMNGDFSAPHTQFAAGTMVVMIAFLYLVLTQSLGGKTFGMMFTNTRVVNAFTFEQPSPGQIILRSLGYVIAFAPLLLGFFIAVIHHKRRGLHDLISGTQVARDF